MTDKNSIKKSQVISSPTYANYELPALLTFRHYDITTEFWVVHLGTQIIANVGDSLVRGLLVLQQVPPIGGWFGQVRVAGVRDDPGRKAGRDRGGRGGGTSPVNWFPFGLLASRKMAVEVLRESLGSALLGGPSGGGRAEAAGFVGHDVLAVVPGIIDASREGQSGECCLPVESVSRDQVQAPPDGSDQQDE